MLIEGAGCSSIKFQVGSTLTKYYPTPDYPMYLTIGIHYPKPGKESLPLESMRKFGEAQRKHKGLIRGTC